MTSNLFRLDGKVAVVVGGAGGIGQAIADGLAEFGANVAVASRNLANLESVVNKLNSKHGSKSSAFEADVTSEKDVAELVNRVTAKYGTVDILVNSQGLNIKKRLTEFPTDDWDRMFDVNVKGMMLACREFGKVMIEKKKGKVINVSSIRGSRATLWGENTAYCGTKGAVDMVTKALASEWAPFNINVNAIAPSLIATKFVEKTLQDPERVKVYVSNVPLKRVGQPSDLVGTSVFLASGASDFITGQVIYVDGGMSAVV